MRGISLSRPFRAAACALALGLFAGCSGTTSDVARAGNLAIEGAATHSIAPADSGKVLTPAVGDRIVFTAEENPSTGYLWSGTADASVLTQVDSSYEQTNPDPNIVGAPGVRTITYAVVGRGRTTLALQYARSFEPASPAQAATYDIVVGAGTQ